MMPVGTDGAPENRQHRHRDGRSGTFCSTAGPAPTARSAGDRVELPRPFSAFLKEYRRGEQHLQDRPRISPRRPEHRWRPQRSRRVQVPDPARRRSFRVRAQPDQRQDRSASRPIRTRSSRRSASSPPPATAPRSAPSWRRWTPPTRSTAGRPPRSGSPTRASSRAERTSGERRLTTIGREVPFCIL